MKIYHNPRCSKSRQTLELIRSKGIEPEIITYMDQGLTVEELKDLIGKLGFQSARELMRRNEKDYKDQDLKNTNDEAKLIKAMSDFPRLIERPIVVSGHQAVLGRPPENALKLL